VTGTALLVAGLSFTLLAALAGGISLIWLRRDRRLRQRMRAARGEPVRPKRAAMPPSERMAVRLVAGIGRSIASSGLLPAKTLAELERTLAASGLRGSNGLSLFVGSKLLLLIACPLITILALKGVSLGPVFDRSGPFIAGALGLLAPDKIVSRNRKKYLAQLQTGIADAMDMMVICTQAGLNMTASMQRVAHEIAHAHPIMSRELDLTVRELQISVDSAAALSGLGARTGLDSLKRVGATLAQTVQYGTPLSEALRVLAAEMRQEALTRFEEKAARLPVMLTIPMILLVLPCVFIVVGGPAVLQIGKALSH
jgi:tight adherence protein C